MVEVTPIVLERVPEQRRVTIETGQRTVICDIPENTLVPSYYSTEIIVEDGAELVLLYDQDIALETHLESSYRIVLGRDAKMTGFFLAQGSAHSIISCEIFLEKSGASASVNGLYVVNGKRTVEFSMRQQHLAADTKSNVVVKGILFDDAKTIFNGTIGIDACAKNSNAVLQNKNLVLSERAWAVSKPCLEVLADAVQCKHGSAIGNLDAEHLFYLRSRGLSEDQAKKELISAFVYEILDLFPDQKIRERWQGKVSGFFKQ